MSCGCRNWRKKTESPFWRGSKKVSGTYFGKVRRSAAARGIPLEISIEDMENQLITQGYRCALSGRQLLVDQNASLDRIDSGGGYTRDNIQWLDKDINRLKSNWPEDIFLSMCREVIEHHGR